MQRNFVLLINPSHDDEVDEKIAVSYGAKLRKIRRYDPPISIINLGGFIRDHGYDVAILDTGIESDYKSRLKDLLKEEPLIVGISVILGKFTKNAIALTKLIKKLNRDVLVVWGGKLVSLANKKILKNVEVDFLVLGDGEYPFLQLLECLRSEKDFRNIPGIGFEENGEVIINKNLQDVSKLDNIYISKDFGWDLVKQHIDYRQVPYFIHLYTSRGCKFNCAFCYLKDVRQLKTRNRFRRRSADNIIGEIDYLYNAYGINVVTFGDDDFLSKTTIDTIVPVFEFLRKKNIYIEHIWTNIYNLTPDMINLLAGVCQTVCYSIETVSPRLQKILNKSIPSGRVIETNKQLRKVGINTVHNFLFGVPTETDEETKANIDFLKKLKEVNPHVRANTYILSPIPDTPIFDFAEKLVERTIKWDIQDLAEFHFRYMGKCAAKFRPYFTIDKNLFYETVSELTNELFAELNVEPAEELLKKVNDDKSLSYIFGDITAIPQPELKERKYILDKVIEAKDAGLPMPRIEPF